MLDAAHGEGVRPVRGVQGVHLARTECQVAGVRIAGSERRRTVVGAPRADVSQGSRRGVAETRSNSHKEQSLE